MGDKEFVNSYWLTRVVLLRYLCFIYTVAFSVSLLQNPFLLGYNGLSPVDIYLNRLVKRFNSSSVKLNFLRNPTLMWFFMDGKYDLDMCMKVLSWVGLIGSSFVTLTGKANKLIMLTLWIAYMSIVNVGQEWFSFGWESQLLESGFLAVFMCHTYSLDMFSMKNYASSIPVMLYRWLLFRIMFGAGMIKVRGDSCWRDYTCMHYHYQTQPVPNPLSYYLHQSPSMIHKLEVVGNHIVELALPWLLLLPQPLVKLGGFFQILFQVILIASGNLSFLNWLTILPGLATFNDSFYSRFFHPQKLARLKKRISNTKVNVDGLWAKFRLIFNSRTFILVLVGMKSVPVVMNIFSDNQIMNTSFDSFQLVNTYGAFGSVTKTRMEVVIEGTHDDNPHSRSAKWLEYEFKCKPGNLYRPPCVISPYHYRLDWLMWFAAFQNPESNPWLYHLLYKFLINDGSVDDLIHLNPFKNEKAPIWIRALHYKYMFADKQRALNSSQWWARTLVNVYLTPVDLKTLSNVAKDFGWDRNYFKR